MRIFTEQVFTRLSKDQQKEMSRYVRKYKIDPSKYIRMAIVEKLARDAKKQARAISR